MPSAKTCVVCEKKIEMASFKNGKVCSENCRSALEKSEEVCEEINHLAEETIPHDFPYPDDSLLRIFDIQDSDFDDFEKENDPVNHPSHYTGHPAGIECIDVIEANTFYNLAAAMKYIWRVSWGSKDNDIQDLEKAAWYIRREIDRRNFYEGLIFEEWPHS